MRDDFEDALEREAEAFTLHHLHGEACPAAPLAGASKVHELGERRFGDSRNVARRWRR
jgi:hypothetical protein